MDVCPYGDHNLVGEERQEISKQVKVYIIVNCNNLLVITERGGVNHKNITTLYQTVRKGHFEDET